VPISFASPHILGQITYFNLFNNTALSVAVGVFGKIVRSTDNGTTLGNTTSPTANTFLWSWILRISPKTNPHNLLRETHTYSSQSDTLQLYPLKPKTIYLYS